MRDAVHNFVSKCMNCIAHSREIPLESGFQSENPAKAPFDRLHIDFLFYNSGKFLLCVDEFSGYPLLIKFRTSPDAEKLIQVFCQMFREHGVPSYIRSDGEKVLTSERLRTFYTENGIKFEQASNYCPTSNPLAEKYVGIVKRILSP